MHASVMRWIATQLPAGAVAGRRVLEVGSYNVNGSVRPYVEAHRPALYVGVDQVDGPGVDLVMSAEMLVDRLGRGVYDIVISTEMLEHVQDWRPCIAQMCEVLRPGGLLLLTTRSPGFPFHPFPVDRWRYTVDVARRIVEAAGLVVWQVVPDSDPASPGVFVRAHKPMHWWAPWAGRDLADVFAAVDAEAVTAP